MDAKAALDELTELSTQVQAAVVSATEGAVVGSTLADAARAEALARAGADALAAAADVRPGGPDVTRVEVALPEGHLFVVREGGRTIAATTVPEPTSGLVLYDLRTVLRRLEEGGAGA